MTEEKAVYDAVPDAVPVEDVVLTLAGQVDDLRRRLDKLQDANLAPVLESSAVLVEIRRIADAAETMAKCVSIDNGWFFRSGGIG